MMNRKSPANKNNKILKNNKLSKKGIPKTSLQLRTQRAPVAINRSSGSRKQSTVVHTEQERVGSVVGSSAFLVTDNYPINPGLPKAFPWLSGIAAHYEKYKINSLIIRYKNLKGSDTDGNIIMSFDYDTLDPPPDSAIQMTQSTVYRDGAPWRIFEMKIPCDNLKRFVRSKTILSGDLKTYDLGRLWIAAEGCADTSIHGYLEFEYSVSFYEKQPSEIVATQNRRLAQWNLQNSTAPLTADTIIAIEEEVYNLPEPVPNIGGVITLPKGWWNVTCEVTAEVDNVNAFTHVELIRDGISFAIPVLAYLYSFAGSVDTVPSTKISTFVESTGSTTIALFLNYAGAEIQFIRDACRIMIEFIQ